MKGTEVVAEAAVRAGCRFFAGYPITPQNEVPEYLARKMPEVGGVFVQGESEVASANMLYGAAASGTRSMTSSSSCGISLMSEAISWMALSNLPAVICNFQRGGPGIGSIQPAQQDYKQATKASGNGGFQMLVLAPSGVQEAADMYRQWKNDEVSYENYLVEDAQLIITAYGISARICRSVVDRMREEGYRVGMIRPKKLNPFPEEAFDSLNYEALKGILSVEMSIPEQYGEDVRIAVRGRTRVDYCLTSGGTILDAEDVYQKALEFFKAFEC